MKRFTLLLLSIMTLETYAQSPMTISTNFSVTYGTGYPKGETMIWEAKNFNENENNTTTLGVWGDSNPQVVANPDKTGINKNDKCLKLTCTDENGFFKMHLPSGFNLNGRRRISMLYKGMGKEFYAQLELVDNFEDTEGSNNWKTAESAPHYLAPMEAYLELTSDVAYARIFVEDFENGVTAIKSLSADEVNGLKIAEGWYTIDGIRLQGAPTQKGIYINNGKKVVVK